MFMILNQIMVKKLLSNCIYMFFKLLRIKTNKNEIIINYYMDVFKILLWTCKSLMRI